MLKPFLIHIKSYVKDNSDFLKKYSCKNNGTTILVTFDVKSLYTSIPHDYGIEAINFRTEKHSQTLHSIFSREFVFESIKTMLENNNCTFNKFYKQAIGTAMCTIFAPTYAVLTMGYFKVHLYDICEVKWGRKIKECLIKNWSRFIDNCETLLGNEKAQLQDYC